MKCHLLSLFALVAIWMPKASAHDTWLETGTAIAQVGEYTYVDLMLGNHGNNHRDFKPASKISLAPCTLSVVQPNGNTIDLKTKMIDMGSAEKEGFWTVKYQFTQAGLHRFIHTLDTLHRTTRAIKSAKTFVLATGIGNDRSLPVNEDRCHGFGLELILKTPFESIQAGEPIELQVMRSGKPLPQARVTFIPRGATLAAEFDADFERQSDSTGLVRFVPMDGNILLAVVHHLEETESGDGYENTHYSAALVMHVPNVALRTH